MTHQKKLSTASPVATVQFAGPLVDSLSSKTHALMALVVFGATVPFRNFAGSASMSEKNWYESKTPGTVTR